MMKTKINIMVENLNSQDDALKCIVMENLEVDMDKLMKLLTGKPVPRKSKFKVEPEPKVETEPEPKVEQKPEPKVEPEPKPAKKKGGFYRKKKQNPVTIPLIECLGVGLYPTVSGPKKVAIWKHNAKGQEVLLWIDKDQVNASHPNGGFPNTNGKLTNVIML